jgi:membrane fusion protein (multidrug efflux system)
MRATIPNPEGALATVNHRDRHHPRAPREARLVVPQAAPQVDQSAYFALVVTAESKVEPRRLKTGPNIGTDVVVLSGLREGDKAIVDGIQKVRPGQLVQETVLPVAGGG